MRKPPRTFALRGVFGFGKETLLFNYALGRRIHRSFRCELPHRMLLNPPLAPMEARSVDEIPTGEGWQYEPKWDGFRCIAFRDGEQIHLQSKAGQPLARYFPDIVHAIARSPAPQFVLDGELVVPVSGALDGIVVKRLDAAYALGERTAAVKVKQIRTADCVVGGFRYRRGTRLVGSLLLGLYGDDGLLHHVGFTSSFTKSERRELTKKFEALKKAPGFTGNAPGGPSRWITDRTGEWEPVAPKIVVEVAYDHFTGGRFRHGTRFLRWRPDKAPRQCTMDQVEQREGKSLALFHR